MTRIIAISAVVVVAIGLAVTAWLILWPREIAGCGTGAVGGDIGGPFRLVDETGAEVTDADVITEPTLIYFGYTFCPDVCPVDSARNAAALEILAGEGYNAQAAFITVDPARDDVQTVAEYTDLFHPDMIGLTGSEEQVKAAADKYRVYFKLNDAEDDEFYLVDHTAFTYLVTPETGFAAFFRREATPEEVATTTACVIDAS